MAEPGNGGRNNGSPSSPGEEEGQRLEDGYRGNLSRPKPQGIISFNKRAQILTVAGLALVFGLIFYGVSQDTRNSSGSGGTEILAQHKQKTAQGEAKAIEDMIPEAPILPKRVETTQNGANDAGTPDWFSGDIKQEQQPQASQPAPVVPPPPVVEKKSSDDAGLAARRAEDAAAARAGTVLGASFPQGGGNSQQQKNTTNDSNAPCQGRGGYVSLSWQQGSGGGSSSGADSAQCQKEELQMQREQFFRSAAGNISRNYIRSVPTAPLSQYEIKAGWLIPAVMEHGINTDLAGMTTARVSQNVYDTVTGDYLLIPQGSRVIGEYKNTVGFAQDRVEVSWDRIIFPDGSSVNLESQKGVDAEGYSGFHDRVNYHWGSVIAAAALMSVFSAIPAYVNNNQLSSTTLTAVDANGNAVQVQNPRAQAAQNVANQLVTMGQTITQRFLNIPPTIEIRPGYRFYIRVQKDLAFLRPYEFGSAEQAASISGETAQSQPNTQNAAATTNNNGQVVVDRTAPQASNARGARQAYPGMGR